MDFESDSSQDDALSLDELFGEEEKTQKQQSRGDNLFGPSVGSFIKSRKANRKKKTTPKIHTQKLPEELASIYDEAQMLYFFSEFNKAKLKLVDLTIKMPEYAGTYNLLGLIHESEDNIPNACDCYFIAAEITKKDTDLWYRVYEMSDKLNLQKRKLYCLTRLIRLLPEEASFYEKRYKLYLQDNQIPKAASDLLSLCHIIHDLTEYIPELYDLCKKCKKEGDLLAYLEESYSDMLQALSRLCKRTNDGVMGMPDASATPPEATSVQEESITDHSKVLLSILQTFCCLAELYIHFENYSKALSVVDQVNSICSIQLPLDMAVVYSVSLLYLGHAEDAIEVVESLGIEENFSDDVADATYSIARAYIGNHQANRAIRLVDCLLTLASHRTTDVFSLFITHQKVYELGYECYREKEDTDKSAEYLLKALEVSDGIDVDKKNKLAIALSQLYDDKGELLRSVDVMNKYFSKNRHARPRQTASREENRSIVDALVRLISGLPRVAVEHLTSEDAEKYVAVIDPLIRQCCSLDSPELYYGHVVPNAEIADVASQIDVAVILGQKMFLQLLWNLTRCHCVLGGIGYISTYIPIIGMIYRFVNPSYQNTLLLLCSIPAFINMAPAAGALRRLFMSCLLKSDGDIPKYVYVKIVPNSVNDEIQSNQVQSDRMGLELEETAVDDSTDAVEAPAHLIKNTDEFVESEISLRHLMAFLSLLLPHVDYSFCVNLFKQMQRQNSVSDITDIFMGEIYLYRNPSTCRSLFLKQTEGRFSNNPLVFLSVGICDLTVGNSRTNPEKRDTILRAFARIQEYSKYRQTFVIEGDFKKLSDYIPDDHHTDMYAKSEKLPVELYKMEVLYNLGRSFHQISLFHIASLYYRAVLDIAETVFPIPDHMKTIWNMFSPERVAAYNLCLLLEASGNKAATFHIRRRYLSI